MKLIQLIFKKVGNHWYLDIDHDNPQDLLLDPILEKYIGGLDKFKSGVVDNIYLEQSEFFCPNRILQFLDSDLLRYFTTKDKFQMTIFINNHKFKISSSLYTILENKYQLDFHTLMYQITIY